MESQKGGAEKQRGGETLETWPSVKANNSLAAKPLIAANA
jgi:hypothetical protein